MSDAVIYSVCRYCAKDCSFRDKIVEMDHCQDAQMDKKTRELHAQDNEKRLNLLLTYSLLTGKEKVTIKDPEFREWVKKR